MFQAHGIQVQALQNELESLKAQLANLKGKFSQPTGHAQHVQGLGSWEVPPELQRKNGHVMYVENGCVITTVNI